MAKQITTDQGTIYIPGGYSSYTVQTNPSGLAVSGVLMLIGEADGGPDFTLEEDLESNAFGPDQVAEVQAKYISGPLVDAFRGAAAAANDPDITNSFSRAILVKTNVSTKASADLNAIGGGTYAVLADKNYGKLGNQIQYEVSVAQAEVVPTTGSFTYIPAVGTLKIGLRVNGGADLALATVSANTPPNTLQAAINALAGVDCSGGANRSIITVAGTLLLDQNPGSAPGALNIKVTRSVAWATTPVVGDTLIIPTGSVLAGGSDENVGAYVVIAADSTTVTATKLSDAGNGAAVIGTITTPTDVSPAVAIVAVTDVMAFSPLTINLTAADVIAGRGKALEISELTSGTDLLSRSFFLLGTTTQASWISKAAGAKLLTSSAEYIIDLALSRSTDSLSEDYVIGGEMPLRIGYAGTTATVTVTDTALTTSVTGGAGANLSLLLKDYPSLTVLAAYINSQPGYTASLQTAALGFISPVHLDNVTAQGICSEFGVAPGRLKIDAWRLSDALDSASVLAQIGDPAAQADAGLPDVSGPGFLAGGAKGSTANSDVVAGLLALESCRGNFVVPLFSRDAADDIADGLTEATSSYAIASVNAAAKSHVLAMSTFKRRRNRQAILSYEGAFADQQDAAANTASFRCCMTFEDVKDIDSNGDIQQFLPWMAAAKAAGMQAGGFYKSIEFKGINISGIVHRAGDFNPKNDTHMENALKAGLMPIRQAETGGFIWVSDQTTYGKDGNFVFNSLQAVYDADLVSLTCAQRMEKAFVGQSLADISASMASTTFDAIMADMMKSKLIAPSDDAKKGFKNASFKISGNSMLVSCEIKLASALDFVVITFRVTPVQQAA